jgi:hypothetical protein
MKKMALSAALSVLTVTSLSAGSATVKGTYVEARTSQIFAGACAINSEAGTTGREALLAWKVEEGRSNGVPLNGLAVVAAVAGDANLSVHEIGGEVANTRTALFVDARATETQRAALVAMAKSLSQGLVGTVVEATPASIRVHRRRPGDPRRDQRVAARRAEAHGARRPVRQQAVVPAVLDRRSSDDGRDGRKPLHRRGARNEVERSEQAVRLLRNLLVLIELGARPPRTTRRAR